MENKIRLIYISLEKFKQYGTGEEKLGLTMGVSSVFEPPKEISLSGACKLISYLSEKVEKENNLEPACQKSVSLVSHILTQYGFEKTNECEPKYFHATSDYRPFRTMTLLHTKKVEGVLDLITVGGDFELFKKCDLHERYFDWFTEGVTKEQAEQICEHSCSKEENKTTEKIKE